PIVIERQAGGKLAVDHAAWIRHNGGDDLFAIGDSDQHHAARFCAEVDAQGVSFVHRGVLINSHISYGAASHAVLSNTPMHRGGGRCHCRCNRVSARSPQVSEPPLIPMCTERKSDLPVPAGWSARKRVLRQPRRTMYS